MATVKKETKTAIKKVADEHEDDNEDEETEEDEDVSEEDFTKPGSHPFGTCTPGAECPGHPVEKETKKASKE